MNDNFLLEEFLEYLSEIPIIGHIKGEKLKNQAVAAGNAYLRNNNPKCQKYPDGSKRNNCFKTVGLASMNLCIKELDKRIPLCNGDRSCEGALEAQKRFINARKNALEASKY
jgi:hypothetical protein